jgi:hypothetical protein
MKDSRPSFYIPRTLPNRFVITNLAPNRVLVFRRCRSGYMLSVSAVLGGIVAGAIFVPGTAGQSRLTQPTGVAGSFDSNRLVRETVQNELAVRMDDTRRWCYRKSQEKDGKRELFAVCQAGDNEIARLWAVDDHPLDATQSRAEDGRIVSLIADEKELNKQIAERLEDAEQAKKLFRLMPDAFLYELEGKEKGLIRLRFTANPDYDPSGRWAQVIHKIEGILLIHEKQKRLIEFSGRLVDDVKFGAGILGHLEKGGTFLVKQQQIAPGHWAITFRHIQMNGQVLFFKTVDLNEEVLLSDFKAVPGNLTPEQAALQTNKPNVSTAQAPRSSRYIKRQ